MELFKLFGTIAVNNAEANSAIDDTTGRANAAGGKIAAGLKTVGKVATAAVGVAATAVGVLTKKAVEEFAEYEQLVGGVETLFKESADVVQGYADNAWKTAGMSANEYMSTATSFSASLLQSLSGDTQKAAEVTEMAITDMSDNANKMGTDMSAIQYAYQGFAKQNYTMLDNLKLGYGGTKEEMERLLADAQKLTGVKYDITNLNDVFQAIHVIQQELGITGTTAKEAATTISGSANAMKAAWSNMLIGIADDTQDFDLLLNNLIESIGTFAQNIIPRVEIALNGVAVLVAKVAPIIIAELPGLMATLLPSLLSAVTGIIESIAMAIPGLMGAILSVIENQGSTIMRAGLDLIVMLGQSLLINADKLITVAISLVADLANWIAENADKMVNGAITLIQTLGKALLEPNNLQTLINAAINLAVSMVQALTNPTNIQKFIDAAKQIVGGIVQGITNNIPAISQALQQIFDAFGALGPVIQTVVTIMGAWKTAMTITNVVSNVVGGITKVINVVKNLGTIIKGLFAVLTANPIALVITAIVALGTAFVHLWNNCEGFRNFFINLWNSIKTTVSNAVNAIKTGITNAWNAIKNTTSNIWNGIKNFFTTVWNGIKTTVSNAINAVKTTVTNVWNAIKTTTTNIWNSIKTAISNVWTGIKTTVTNAINGVKTTITNVWNGIKTTTTNVWNSIKTFISNIWNGIKNTASTIWNGITTTITNATNTVKTKITSIWESIKNFFVNIWNNIKNTASTAFENIKNVILKPIQELPGKVVDIGKNLITGLWNGISSGASWLWDKVSGWANGLIKGVKNLFGVKSPSTIFKSIGKFLMDGFGIGIEENEDAALNPINSLADTINNVELAPKVKIGGNDLTNWKPSEMRLADSSSGEVIERIKLSLEKAVEAKNDELSRKLESLISLLTMYLPILTNKNLKVVLDTGVLVGEITPDVNDELKRISDWKGEGRA